MITYSEQQLIEGYEKLRKEIAQYPAFSTAPRRQEIGEELVRVRKLQPEWYQYEEHREGRRGHCRQRRARGDSRSKVSPYSKERTGVSA